MHTCDQRSKDDFSSDRNASPIQRVGLFWLRLFVTRMQFPLHGVRSYVTQVGVKCTSAFEQVSMLMCRNVYFCCVCMDERTWHRETVLRSATTALRCCRRLKGFNLSCECVITHIHTNVCMRSYILVPDQTRKKPLEKCKTVEEDQTDEDYRCR